MADKPTLSPLEALNKHRENDNKDFEQDGFSFTTDGPMNSSAEFWAPIAILLDDNDVQFFTSGEVGDPVTAESYWVQI